MSNKSKLKQKYQEYVNILRKRADVDHSIGVLSWDKEVNLPPKGVRFRSQQVATLSGIAHEIFTNKKFGKVLKDLNEKQE